MAVLDERNTLSYLSHFTGRTIFLEALSSLLHGPHWPNWGSHVLAVGEPKQSGFWHFQPFNGRWLCSQEGGDGKGCWEDYKEVCQRTLHCACHTQSLIRVCCSCSLPFYPTITNPPHHLFTFSQSNVHLQLTPLPRVQIRYGCSATEHQWIRDSLDPERPLCWAINILGIWLSLSLWVNLRTRQ